MQAQPGLFQDDVEQFVQFDTVAAVADAVDQLLESGQGILGASVQSGRFADQGRSAPQRQCRIARHPAQFIQRTVADAARRRIDRAFERGIIIGIGYQPQIGHGILDFHALEEALAAVHPVRQRVR